MTASDAPVTRKTFQAPAAWKRALNKDQLQALTGHVQHLLAESPEAHGYAPPDQTPTPEALHDIAKWLRANRKVDELFVPAMCCALPGGTATGRFGTHILIAALNETTRDRRQSVALHACREIRLMCLGKRPELMQRIEHAPVGPTSDVLNWINEERSKPPPDENGASDEPPPPDRQLARLESLLERYVNNRVIERRDIDNLRRHARPVGPLAETDGVVARTVRAYNDRIAEDADSAKTLIVVDSGGAPAHQRSLGLQERRAKAQRSRIVRAHMMSPCSWGVPSTHELETLVRELWSGVNAGRAADPLLFISLLTGRCPYDLARMTPKDYGPLKQSAGTRAPAGWSGTERLEYHGPVFWLRTFLDRDVAHWNLVRRAHHVPSHASLPCPYPFLPKPSTP